MIKKIFNNIKEDKEVLFDNLDKITWLTLILWMLYQFINLSGIWKILFFSWTQVITDTVIIIWLLVVTMLWISVWLFNPKKNNPEDKDSTTGIFILYIFLWIIMSTSVIFILLQFNLNNLVFYYLIWFTLTILFRITLYIKWHEMDVSDFYKHEVLILSIIAIFSVFSLMKSDFSNYSIKVEKQWVESKIKYFNDKYIILEDKVIHNNSDVIFYSK